MPLTILEDGDLLFGVENRVGTLTFNRSESRNALTFEMYDQLALLSDEISSSGELDVLVLTGAGGKAFAAGTDISAFRNLHTEQQALDYERKMDHVLARLESVPVPTIAAITGACTGGGAAIAAACDIRISDHQLRYGFPIARTLGNCLSNQNLSRQIWLLGASRVSDLMLTARLMDAREARNCSLVAEVCDNPLERALALAGELQSHAPLSMQASKEAIRRLREHAAAVDTDDLIVRCYTSRDFREGIDAFLNKRKPRWQGK